MRLVLAIALVMFACGKKDEPATKAEKLVKVLDEHVAKDKDRKPTGAPRPQTKLAVTYDGKPITMANALAWKRYDGSIGIAVSSVPLTCGEVTGQMRSIYDGEVTFDVIVGQNLQPDGKMQALIRQWTFDASTIASATPSTGTGDGSPGQPTTVDVDFKATGVAMQGPAHELVVKGTVDALGCEAAKQDTAAPPPEQPATIEVAGKRLAVRTAVYSKVGEWPNLELRTGGEGCASKAHEQPSEFRINLTWFKADKPEVSQVSLGGSLLPNNSDQLFDKKKLVVKPVPTGAGVVEMHGEIKVMSYPVKLDGKVTVIECPKS